jgi:hypothetical protein
MKVLIISHYLNFNLNQKNITNIFPNLLLKAIKDAGGTYVVCGFRKTDLISNVNKGCDFILNFEEASTENAINFNNNKYKTAVKHSYSESDISKAIDIMFKTLISIEKKVPMYPTVKVLQLIKSKTYLTVIPNKTKLFMPHTKTFMYYKTTVSEELEAACKYFLRRDIYGIVVKFGYSGDSEHVFRYSIYPEMEKADKEDLMTQMAEYSHRCGRPYLVILQPFNPIISNRLNEYRCLFTGGVMSPVAAFGFRTCTEHRHHIFIPSIELDPDNIEHAEIIAIAKYGYTQFSKYIGFTPPVLRVDVSWVIENGVKRYYINEFEGLSGTYYFNIPYVPKENGTLRLTDVYDCLPETCNVYPPVVPSLLAHTLVRYIRAHIK